MLRSVRCRLELALCAQKGWAGAMLPAACAAVKRQWGTCTGVMLKSQLLSSDRHSNMYCRAVKAATVQPVAALHLIRQEEQAPMLPGVQERFRVSSISPMICSWYMHRRSTPTTGIEV